VPKLKQYKGANEQYNVVEIAKAAALASRAAKAGDTESGGTEASISEEVGNRAGAGSGSGTEKSWMLALNQLAERRKQ
jgi:hypothetical protein